MLTLEERVFPGKSTMFIAEIYIPVALYMLIKIPIFRNVYMQLITITKKRDHEFKREKAGVYGRFWNRKGKEENCNYIRISSIKMKI